MHTSAIIEWKISILISRIFLVYIENIKEDREQYCADLKNFELRSRTWKIVASEKEKWKIRKF